MFVGSNIQFSLSAAFSNLNVPEDVNNTTAQDIAQSLQDNPVMQFNLVSDLIDGKPMNDKTITAMRLCTPCVADYHQNILFENKLVPLLWSTSIPRNIEVALRFFTSHEAQTAIAVAKDLGVFNQ